MERTSAALKLKSWSVGRVKREWSTWKTCDCLFIWTLEENLEAFQMLHFSSSCTAPPVSPLVLIAGPWESHAPPWFEMRDSSSGASLIFWRHWIWSPTRCPPADLSLSSPLSLTCMLKLEGEGLALCFGFFSFFFFPEFVSLLGCLLPLFLDDGQSCQISSGLLRLPLKM